MTDQQYRAVISSDWSECLSPNGPFDPIAFNYPELEPNLKRIFRCYTGNTISLRTAIGEIERLLPKDLSVAKMDAYLDAQFQTYKGVPELIQWCKSRDILFMINTTSTQGYFQRVFSKGLVPEVPLVAANAMVNFSDTAETARFKYLVTEIEDKPKNTAAVMDELKIPANRVIVIGDSGGDGPHFQWAFNQGAFLIGSMTKNSLSHYCRSRGIRINKFFGTSYGADAVRNLEEEMTFDFMELADVILEVTGL